MQSALVAETSPAPYPGSEPLWLKREAAVAGHGSHNFLPVSLSLSLSLPICLRAHECLMRRNLLCVARPLSPPPQSVSRTKPPNRQGKRCLRIKCESINQQPWFDFNNQLSELRKLMRNMRIRPSLLVLFKKFITCCLTHGTKFSMCLKSKILIMPHFQVVNTSRALDLSPFGRDMNN